jgi:hypothetical protein
MEPDLSWKWSLTAKLTGRRARGPVPGKVIPGAPRRGANQRARSRARASHANAAAHRAAIAMTADHPARGDAWVVRRTARCGNVVGAAAAVRQQV